MFDFLIFKVKPDPIVSNKSYIGAQCASGLEEGVALKMLPSSAMDVKKVKARSAREAIKLYGNS